MKIDHLMSNAEYRKRFLQRFNESSLRIWLRDVWHGLRQPRDSTDYRWAAWQLYHLWSVLAAFMISLSMLFLLMVLAPEPPPDSITSDWIIIDPVPEQDIVPTHIPDPPFPEPPVPVIDPPIWSPDLDRNTLTTTDSTTPDQKPEIINPPTLISLRPNPGIVIMKTLYNTRIGPNRDKALAKYGQGVGATTEPAVLRALRWLKQEQRPNGSWNSPPVAMTGLALLCFLAHGEIPDSEEFGDTVRRAMEYLLSVRRPDGRFPGNYDMPIATYALCEAFGITRIPMLYDGAEQALDILVRGQHESGGWDYNCQPGTRDDTSYMGWCVQALKAGHMADITHPSLQTAMQKAVHGFQNNAHPAGGFGYTGPGQGGLTGVGVLSLQLLGAAREPECRRGIAWLESITCDWDKPWGARPLYYWYYATQAKFHEGGNTWNQWNKQFAVMVASRQTLVKGAGPDGVDTGYWIAPTETEQSLGNVYSTCLCTLMLEVYYRYLPTFQTPEPGTVITSGPDETDVPVDIHLQPYTPPLRNIDV